MTLTQHRSNPIAEMLGMLDKETAEFLGLGLTPYIRVEDFVEDDVYVLRAEMPGIDPDRDVRIDVAGDVLTIHGARQEERQEFLRQEFHYGEFTRSVALPQNALVDAIKASYRDGILELRVPLLGEAPQALRIPIQRPEDALPT